MIAGQSPKMALVKLSTLQQALLCVQIAKHAATAMCGILSVDLSEGSATRAIDRHITEMKDCEAALEKAIAEAESFPTKRCAAKEQQ